MHVQVMPPTVYAMRFTGDHERILRTSLFDASPDTVSRSLMSIEREPADLPGTPKQGARHNAQNDPRSKRPISASTRFVNSALFPCHSASNGKTIPSTRAAWTGLLLLFLERESKRGSVSGHSKRSGLTIFPASLGSFPQIKKFPREYWESCPR